jgi:hypothetical protein
VPNPNAGVDAGADAAALLADWPPLRGDASPPKPNAPKPPKDAPPLS